MIVYCVKTDEYLRAIVERVSFGAEYYCQFDVPFEKAESIIKKLTERYKLDQTARQRNYALKTKPVVDLAVGGTKSLFNANKVRLCLCCTMPPGMRDQELNVDTVLKSAYELTNADKEQFYAFSDRNNRFNFYTVVSPTAVEKNKYDQIPVYTLLRLNYTAEERKQKNATKNYSWTFCLSKKFVKLKTEHITKAFKTHQKTKSREIQDKAIAAEIAKLASLVGFRGVRDDVFKINSMIQPTYFKYFNRPCSLELKVPYYQIKQKFLVKNFKDFSEFHK